ncbi:MAG TPA: serine protease [Pseudolabrys sp.]|nr:serine protease [Pseudolabrys sp.]
MPWIEPRYLESTVYLYPSEKEADDGDAIGGSGFIVGIPVDEDRRQSLLFVVTNKHVVDDGNMVVRLNTVDGKRDTLALDGEHWFFHPDGDDLAVCPIGANPLHKAAYYFVPAASLITKEDIREFEIGPGDDVFIIGRFINHEGKQQNLPSARFGNIAQMPWEPIVIDGFPQESFLVEARSIAGYSGSPVFVYCQPPPVPHNLNPVVKNKVRSGELSLPGVSRKRLDIPIRLGPWLLGIDYCHIRWDEPVLNKQTGKPVNPDWFIKSNTGMMGVIPAWKLQEIFQGPELGPLIDAYKKHIAKEPKKSSAVELDSAKSPESTDENPKGREDFTFLLNAAARKQKQGD